MIDFHNHIIPNLDDGPKTMDIALSMAKTAEKQGIKKIINTVHFNHPKMIGKKINFEIVDKAVKKFQQELINNNINIEIDFASEVFFTNDLLDVVKEKIATFGNGKYILVEFLPNRIPSIHKEIFFELKMNNITPIIAHPERYKAVQNNYQIIYDWLYAGCLIQLDAGSIIGSFGKKCQKLSQKIVNDGLFQIIGSDAHDNKKRNFCLKETIQFVKLNMGLDISDSVSTNPQKILSGIDFETDIGDYDIKELNLYDKIINKIKSYF